MVERGSEDPSASVRIRANPFSLALMMYYGENTPSGGDNSENEEPPLTADEQNALVYALVQEGEFNNDLAELFADMNQQRRRARDDE